MKNFSNLTKVVLIGILTTFCIACRNQSDSINSANNNQFVIGWQTAWAPSGQIAQTLIHTDIAKQEKIDLKFIGFLFGPDINEAAINHNINCLNTGNVPAVSLLAKSKNWIIISRLIRQPLSIVAGVNSGIHQVSDLKNKTIGVPFGSGPHPYLLCLLKSHKLWDGKSELPVKLVNIAPSEQLMALQQKAVDAIATWEPQTTIANLKKLGTVINEEPASGFIIVQKEFAIAHHDSVVHLLKAYLWAEYFVATHKQITDDWFAHDSRFSQELISKIKIIEPNLLQIDPKKIDLNINDQDLKLAQEYADAMYNGGLVTQPVNLKDRIDLSYLNKAQKEWLQDAVHLPAVNIGQP